MKIPLLSGNFCSEDLNAVNVVVNRSFANTYLNGATGIGRHVHALNNLFIPKGGEIRGVVGDAREEGMTHEPGPTVYWCIAAPLPDPYYLLRTSADPMALAEAVRQRIHEIEPSRSVFYITPLTDHLSEEFS